MRIAIVQFPGSNCERETMLAVERAGMRPVSFLWNESSSKLAAMDGYIIVGGFSYEDRSRAGIIAALDPVMQEIKKQSELGKPVLGICNGAQILVETGMVPGLKNYQLAMALTDNKRILDGKILGTGFFNTWVHLRLSDKAKPSAFTRHLNLNHILTVPIAHAQGRFVMSDDCAREIVEEGLNVFQYCDEEGRVIDNFPVNPNGSMLNSAAIMNKAGNVMAIMPHPERTEAGDALFSSMRDYILEAKPYEPAWLAYHPQTLPLIPYYKRSGTHECIVKLIITDNEALTVQNTLRQLNIPVQVSRMVHWQVQCSLELLDSIKQTGVLYNERKEYLINQRELSLDDSCAFLVRSRDDLKGQQKVQILDDHFSIDEVQAIHQGILWIFTSDKTKMNDLKEAILKTNIIFNPYADVCYEYH